MVDRLIAFPNVSPHAEVRLQLIKARGTWSQGVYSVSLDALSAATTSFICLAIPSLESDLEQTEDFLASCLPFVSTWHHLATAAMQHKLGPALDYLLAIAEVSGRREGGGLGSLPTYALWLAAREQGNWGVFEQLEHRLPGKLRSDKFERIFTVKSMTEETKNFFATDHVKRLLTEKFVISNTEAVQNSPEIEEEASVGDQKCENAQTEASEPLKETSDASKPEVQSQNMYEENLAQSRMNPLPDDHRSEAINIQLLEIGILELVAAGKVQEVGCHKLVFSEKYPFPLQLIDMIQESAALGRLPTKDAIQVL